MSDDAISYRPIGIIHSEHTIAGNTPIQPAYARGCKGRAEVFPEFAAGLRDVEGFSHLFLILLLLLLLILLFLQMLPQVYFVGGQRHGTLTTRNSPLIKRA